MAARKVTGQFMANEKERRLTQAAPLLQAMEELERPRGCWAYTVTSTRRRDGEVTLIEVARYDPFQPEEKIWTLVSRNGVAPDDAAQSDYRAKKLKAWRKAASRQAKTSESEQVRNAVLFARLETSESAPDSATEFRLLYGRTKVPFLGDMPPSQQTYTIEHAVLTRRSSGATEPASFLGGTVKVDHFDGTTDFAVIDPAVPPFVVKTVVHLRVRRLGVDSGELAIEDVYTDYHRVKCYDDRFETSVGPPNVTEFIPN